jgi:hypothetical protein
MLLLISLSKLSTAPYAAGPESRGHSREAWLYRCQTDSQVSLFVGFLISWISLPTTTTKIGTPRIKVISQYLWQCLQEPQVLDHQTQQYKLLPLLATTYAFKFAAMGMSIIYSKISGEIDRGNLEALPQVLWNHFYSWGTNFRGCRG